LARENLDLAQNFWVDRTKKPGKADGEGDGAPTGMRNIVTVGCHLIAILAR